MKFFEWKFWNENFYATCFGCNFSTKNFRVQLILKIWAAENSFNQCSHSYFKTILPWWTFEIHIQLKFLLEPFVLVHMVIWNKPYRANCIQIFDIWNWSIEQVQKFCVASRPQARKVYLNNEFIHCFQLNNYWIFNFLIQI